LHFEGTLAAWRNATLLWLHGDVQNLPSLLALTRMQPLD
jgi:hypothetical protein